MTTTKVVFDEPDRQIAHAIASALENLFDPGPSALTLFECDAPNGSPRPWRIEAYFDTPQDTEQLTSVVRSAVGQDISAGQSDAVPDLNWVALSQAALPPVLAGRFTIHGSHDTNRVAMGPNSILIDAGEAFGTAHHATTYGCLLALDQQLRVRPARRVLDLGCGSGVLAIAVTRLCPKARVLASDLDQQSVAVAKANMAANRAARRIQALCSDGFNHPRLRAERQFDLIIANILAGPLLSLAGAMGRALQCGGVAVLSGLLINQAPSVIAAYRAHGFRLVSHRRIAGWSTLTLQKQN
jgi:ribosomal protein L11 methyltransferase